MIKKIILEGVYKKHDQAERAVRDLKSEGFTNPEVLFEGGNIRISIQADSTQEVERARDCLVEWGAQDIHSSDEDPGDWKPSQNQMRDQYSDMHNIY